MSVSVAGTVASAWADPLVFDLAVAECLVAAGMMPSLLRGARAVAVHLTMRMPTTIRAPGGVCENFVVGFSQCLPLRSASPAARSPRLSRLLIFYLPIGTQLAKGGTVNFILPKERLERNQKMQLNGEKFFRE
jgi:hypothetical protein